MRGPLAELATPHPLGQTLPSLYLGDPFTQSLCEALDGVLAPVLSALDNLPAYLDLSTAPDDLLPWLARWIGMVLDPGQQPARQRELLRSASIRQGWQGTSRGIQQAVEALLGVRVEVIDSGGAAWSVDAQDPLPGDPVATVAVRVFPSDDQQVDEQRLDAVVRAIKPAHVTHRVQIVSQAQAG